jgi:hypothetical protein
LAKRAKKKEEDVDSYRHEAETRKNAVPVGLASYDTSKPKPKKYDYDPHLDPQLELLTSTKSLPFKLGKEKRIAVKVIDDKGSEVMVVREG